MAHRAGHRDVEGRTHAGAPHGGARGPRGPGRLRRHDERLDQRHDGRSRVSPHHHGHRRGADLGGHGSAAPERAGSSRRHAAHLFRGRQRPPVPAHGRDRRPGRARPGIPARARRDAVPRRGRAHRRVRSPVRRVRGRFAGRGERGL